MKRIAFFAIGAGVLAFGSLGVAQVATTAPRYVYAQGAQGAVYYPQATQAAAPRQQTTTAPASGAGRSVGPGVRNWATGNRVPLHRPWMRGR